MLDFSVDVGKGGRLDPSEDDQDRERHEPQTQPAFNPQAKLTQDTSAFLPRQGPPASCIFPEWSAACFPSLRSALQFPPV